jgi:hypothetical protein
MERETTVKARALIRASYDKVIKAINSDKGKIILSGKQVDAIALDNECLWCTNFLYR